MFLFVFRQAVVLWVAVGRVVEVVVVVAVAVVVVVIVAVRMLSGMWGVYSDPVMSCS